MQKPEIEHRKSFVNLKKRSKTNYIVVHCSATRALSKIDAKAIDQIHRQDKGYLMIGYHFVIKTDGTIQEGRPLDTIGAHVKGYNDCSVGVCLIGGIDVHGKSCNNFTEEQLRSLESLLLFLQDKYKDAEILGHRDFKGVSKDCPCFDVKSWYNPNIKLVDYLGEGLHEVLSEYNMSVEDFYDVNPEFDPESYYGKKIWVRAKQ